MNLLSLIKAQVRGLVFDDDCTSYFDYEGKTIKIRKNLAIYLFAIESEADSSGNILIDETFKGLPMGLRPYMIHLDSLYANGIFGFHSYEDAYMFLIAIGCTYKYTDY